MSHLNGKPGFNRQMLNTLRQKHQDDPWQFTYYSLVIDGMSLKTNLQWNLSQMRMDGLVDLGLGPGEGDEDEGGMATEAIVFLTVGLLGHWKAPVAYFLCNKLSADVQGELVQQCIIELTSVGLSVEAVVMDGLSANVAMVKKFGCSLNPDNICPLFPHPCNTSDKLCVIFDACHMLKLLRNLFHSYGSITVPGVGVAEFQHVSRLHETQVNEDQRVANKLTARHTDFERQKMKVKLAAQFFSSSVAKALNLARQRGMTGFEQTQRTEHLCSVVDRLFDFLNSKNIHTKGYKAELTYSAKRC